MALLMAIAILMQFESSFEDVRYQVHLINWVAYFIIDDPSMIKNWCSFALAKVE